MLGRVLGVWALGCLLWACGETSSNADGSNAEGSGGSDAGGSGGSDAGGSGGSDAGGSGGSGGEGDGGTGSNLFVDQLRTRPASKLDVLFVIDNSIGMADKQALLSQAVPGFLERLVNPDCVRVDNDGVIVERLPGPDCGDDFAPEFPSLEDIHLGVITSSLGGHGGDICSNFDTGVSSWNETKNDRGRLLPTVRPDLNLPSSDPAGFLAWSGNDSDQLKADFAEQVQGAGEVGCGYEATLESWYRFLIDPSPPLDMVVENDIAAPTLDANGDMIVDTTLLEQRAAFLRPDSIVVVAMLSDENDCSIVDGGIAWLASSVSYQGNNFMMPAATTSCDANPNDPCCRSCGLGSTVSDCPPLAEDANCQAGRPSGSDSPNLRCHNQKQRFGFDLLYPVERYVAALTEPQIADTHRCEADGNCPLVQNPLFDTRGAANPRDPSQVYLAGIVGVPWQDIATEETLHSQDSLEFMSAAELAASNRWDVMLGDPEAENPKAPEALPDDPLMIEQSEPREGSHPITGEAVAPETSENPLENSINGHEYVNDDDTDLQYACIFPLAEPRDCSSDENQACDCASADLPKNRPLCTAPGGSEAGSVQYFGKAYPAPRLLQTLRDVGDKAIVASACPRVTTGEPDHPAFGYNPAITAIVDSISPQLGTRCLPRSFSVDDEGRIACSIVEVVSGAQDCDPAMGRSDVDESLAVAVLDHCRSTGTACTEASLCQIEQLSGDDQRECQSTLDYAGSVPGFCYVDPSQGVGDEAVLVGCPATERRKLQFVGEDTPARGALTFVVCEEAGTE